MHLLISALTVCIKITQECVKYFKLKKYNITSNPTYNMKASTDKLVQLKFEDTVCRLNIVLPCIHNPFKSSTNVDKDKLMIY